MGSFNGLYYYLQEHEVVKMAKDLVRFGGVGSQVGQEPAKLLPKQEIGGKGLRYIDIGYHSFVPASMQYVVDTIRGSVQGSSVNTGQENFQLAVKDVGNKAEWKHRMENYDAWKQDYDNVITEGHDKGKPTYTTTELMDSRGYDGTPLTSAAKRATARALDLQKIIMEGTPGWKVSDASNWAELVSEVVGSRLHELMLGEDPEYALFYNDARHDTLRQLVKGPGGQSIDQFYGEEEQWRRNQIAQLWLLRKSEIFGGKTEELLGPEYLHGVEETTDLGKKYLQSELNKLGSKNKTFAEVERDLRAISKTFVTKLEKKIQSMMGVTSLAKADLVNAYKKKPAAFGEVAGKSAGGGKVEGFGKFGAQVVDRLIEIAWSRLQSGLTPKRGYYLFQFPITFKGKSGKVVGGMAMLRLEPVFTKTSMKGAGGIHISGILQNTGIVPMGEKRKGILAQFMLDMAMHESYLASAIYQQEIDFITDIASEFISYQAGRGVAVGHLIDQSAHEYMSHFQPFVGLRRLMTKGDIAKSIMEQVKEASTQMESGIAEMYKAMVRDSEHLTGLWKKAGGTPPLYNSAAGYQANQNSESKKTGIWNPGDISAEGPTGGVGVPYIINLTGKAQKLPLSEASAAFYQQKGATKMAGAHHDIADKSATLRELGPMGRLQVKGQEYGPARGKKGRSKFARDVDAQMSPIGAQMEEIARLNGMGDRLDEFWEDPNKYLTEWGTSTRWGGFTMDKGQTTMPSESRRWEKFRGMQARTWEGMRSGMPTVKDTSIYKEWEKHKTWQGGVDPTSGLTDEEYNDMIMLDILELEEDELNERQKRKRDDYYDQDFEYDDEY